VTGAPEALPAADNLPHEPPLQPAPDNDQLTPLFCESLATVAAKFCVPLTETVVDVGDSVTMITGPAGVTVIVAAADFVPSATDVAVSVTFAGVGTVPGAVYVTAAPDALLVVESVPQVDPLQPPDKAQVTPLVALSFATAAVKFALAPTITLAVVCDRATLIGAAAAVTVIAPDETFVPSATDVAVTVTLGGLGTLAGAV
jgi:hypothetical protein